MSPLSKPDAPDEPFFFMQISDPQLGMFESRGLFDPGEGLAFEIEHFEMAIAEANRLGPEFVVVTGDLCQNRLKQSEVDEIKRIAANLQGSIPIYWAAGNCDSSYEGDITEPELLTKYREEFGPDYYSFRHNGTMFITLSSTILFDPRKVQHEYAEQMEFIEDALAESADQGDARRIVFMHHPLFTGHPDEEDGRARLPKARRKPLLQLFRKYGVDAVFSGHLHRNNYAKDGDMLMVATTSIGFQGGDDSPGYRIVKVLPDAIEHEFYPVAAGPQQVLLGQ